MWCLIRYFQTYEFILYPIPYEFLKNPLIFAKSSVRTPSTSPQLQGFSQLELVLGIQVIQRIRLPMSPLVVHCRTWPLAKSCRFRAWNWWFLERKRLVLSFFTGFQNMFWCGHLIGKTGPKLADSSGWGAYREARQPCSLLEEWCCRHPRGTSSVGGGWRIRISTIEGI